MTALLRPRTFHVVLTQTLYTMAKVSAKTAAAPKERKAAPAKTKKTSASSDIEKTGEEVLKKLQSLNRNEQLQADIEWCLGSYRHDKNPVGLLEAIKNAHTVLKEELSKKTKGVTAKFVSDVEKVLK